MATKIFVLLFFCAPCLSQDAYYDPNSEIWDYDEQALEIESRNSPDYGVRDAYSFETTCAIIKTPLHPDYRYIPHLYNTTCREYPHSLNTRHSLHKDFCIIKHQQRSNTHKLCQTVYRKMPFFGEEKGKRLDVKELNIGIGCTSSCRIAVKFD